MADNGEQQQREEGQAQEEQEAATVDVTAATDETVQQEGAAGDPEQTEQAADTAQEQGEEDGGEGVADGGDGAEGEGEKQEEKVVISHEDNPHWLSPEDCRAKGIPEDQISAFQHTYFQLAYSLKTWYESLSDHTFPTEFITLTATEVEVLLSASRPGQAKEPELADEQKETLQQLEKKLNDALEKFEEDGGFIRVNDRNPNDAILERNDAEFVARIRDAVINELEVLKQSVNAYRIWGDQEKTEGAFRRGMTRLRQSFRRQRAPSTSTASKKDKTSNLEETTGQEGETGEKTEGEAAAATAEATGQEREGEGEGEGEKKEESEAAVTVEAQVEGEGEKEGKEEPKEQEAAAEPEPAQQTEEETKPDEDKKPDEEDIEKAPAEQEPTEPDETPKPKEELPPVRKIKSESLDNEILRAFGRAVTAMYRVTDGKTALEMLLRSGVIKQYLEQVKGFGDVEGVSVTISVTRFHADIARYPGMVLRGFVYEGELTALSQKHDDITYFPNVAQYKNIIQYKVKKFYDEHVKETLAERGSYVIDMFVSTEKVYILRLSPFYTGTGACLFTWAEHGKLLTKPPVNFKIIDSAHKAPEIYSGLQSHWNSMLDSVLMQKQNEQRSQSGRGCTIL